jgi:hypothetical protein
VADFMPKAKQKGKVKRQKLIGKFMKAKAPNFYSRKE